MPCHPALIRYLRWHISEFGTAPDGRLFRGERGGDLSESVYGRVWQGARLLAFTPALEASPLARRPYELRHACLSSRKGRTPRPDKRPVFARAKHHRPFCLNSFLYQNEQWCLFPEAGAACALARQSITYLCRDRPLRNAASLSAHRSSPAAR